MHNMPKNSLLIIIFFFCVSFQMQRHVSTTNAGLSLCDFPGLSGRGVVL